MEESSSGSCSSSEKSLGLHYLPQIYKASKPMHVQHRYKLTKNFVSVDSLCVSGSSGLQIQVSDINMALINNVAGNVVQQILGCFTTTSSLVHTRMFMSCGRFSRSLTQCLHSLTTVFTHKQPNTRSLPSWFNCN